jgi:hypothetical protein
LSGSNAIAAAGGMISMPSQKTRRKHAAWQGMGRGYATHVSSKKLLSVTLSFV